MLLFVSQLAAGDRSHRQQVRGLPERRVEGEQTTDARQPGALLPLLHRSLRPRVSDSGTEPSAGLTS